ncbi:MAG: patatin-like phospholipase family protein [Tepidiformaceae bacterium]
MPALFASLDEASLELFRSAAELLPFEAGQVVVEVGSTLDHLYIVEDGLLCAEVADRHGLPMELARFGHGAYCGEMAFLRGEPAAATVRALVASTLWRIPHATLGAIADRSPSVMREMAQGLASRLADTNRRFRELRPGHVAVCLGDTPAALAFLAQVARSAARQLAGPVIVLDLTDSPGAWRAAPLPAVAEIAVDPGRLSQVAAFGSKAAAAVGLIQGEAGDAESAAFLQLLGEVRRVCELVIVFAPSRCTLTAAMLDGASGAVLLHEEGTALPPLAADVAAILLGGRAPHVAPGGIAAYSAHSGRTLLRAVPADAAVFEGERPGAAAMEPWLSVDWAARHLLKRKVGLALGAGGAKGYAHLGAIEALRSAAVPIDFVAGSSIGAPLATAVARNVPARAVRAMLDATFARAMRLTVPYHSFFSSRTLRHDMEHYNQGQTFERLRIPLAITAVDLYRAAEVVFRSGDIAVAIVASMAIPGIFRPVRVGGRLLVDGGLLNPLPIATVAALGADVVIAVKLATPLQQVRTRNSFRAPPIVETIHSAFEVMQWHAGRERAANADVTIEPLFTGPTGLRDFSRGDEFIAAGRAAAEAALPAIRRLLPGIS